MNTILVIWTIVGFTARPYDNIERHDWRPIGEFSSAELCHKAAKTMNVPKDFYRCLETYK